MLASLAEERNPDQGAAGHDIRRAAFAERLKEAMGRKGWGLSETARQASQLLGPHAKFGRAHVWHYLHARAVPRARQLNALSKALDIGPDELLGYEPSARNQEVASVPMGIVRAHDQGNGTVFLEVAQRVPWATALEILRALQSSDSPLSERNPPGPSETPDLQ
jgi:transcriptional regulator with XRE-family HTH domain